MLVVRMAGVLVRGSHALRAVSKALTHSLLQCYGSGSAWIRIDLAVLDPDVDADPDPGGWKLTKTNK
jgi:hypothetical protein